MIYGHGDDIFKYPDVRINFSSNIYNHFDHSGLFRHLSDGMAALCTYPEPTPQSLERHIAEYLHLSPANIMVINGATEAIYLVAQAHRGAHSVIPQPTFAEYADACQMYGHTITPVPTTEGRCLHWLCSPNNPTGTVIPKDSLLELLRNNPHTLFVLDASYSAYTCEQQLTPAEGLSSGNLVMLHSMTKDYGLPGIRLGYIIAPEHEIAMLKALRMPWSVGQLSILAGHYLLDHSADYTIDVAAVNAERSRVATALEAKGITVHPSQSNMLLCRHPTIPAATLKHNLATMHGILIRDASNFPTLSDYHFRIAVQSREENDTLLRYV